MSTVTARLEEAQRLAVLLVEQLTGPVKFTQAVRGLVKDGRLVHVFNQFGHATAIDGPCSLGPGRHELTFAFANREGVLSIDGAEVGRGTVAHGLPFRWQIGGAGLTIGRDRGFPVVDDYETPFAFTATLEQVHSPTPSAVRTAASSNGDG